MEVVLDTAEITLLRSVRATLTADGLLQNNVKLLAVSQNDENLRIEVE